MRCDPRPAALFVKPIRLLILIAACAGPPTDGLAQIGGGIGGNAGGIGNQAGGGNQIGGILIDAEGVVRSIEPETLSPQLQQAARDAFLRDNLNDDVASYCDRRHVSLVRLERECERRLQADEPLDEPLRHLAGLQRIDYLFVAPDGSDLVIAGPAEGFVPDASGRMVGLTTGRPPLRLDDVIFALQAADAGLRAIGCSIDPAPARLAQMQQFVKRNSSTTSPAGAARRYEQMAKILGRQDISVFGVPADSHFAATLVEADFRMKRISLGIEPSGVRGLRSHLSLIAPGGNSIQRWWFVPNYDGLFTTGERTAFQLTGQRVQLLAQEEIASAAGQRSDAASTRASTHRFAKLFTAKFPELAERSPLFAELQNLFDLAIVAALIHHEGLAETAGWDRSLFSRTDPALVPKYEVPRHVPSMTTFRRAGRGLILGLVGGVTIDPRQVLHQIDSGGESAPRLGGIRSAAFDAVPAGDQTWWWD